MTAQREDEASIASMVADALDASPLWNGWEARGLDIGEVEIDVPNGQRFRLSVEEIDDEDGE